MPALFFSLCTGRKCPRCFMKRSGKTALLPQFPRGGRGRWKGPFDFPILILLLPCRRGGGDSPHARHGQLAWRDFHPLECSLVGCFRTHWTTNKVSWGLASSNLP